MASVSLNLRTGRNAAQRPAALKDLEVYSQGPLPTPPVSVSVPTAAYPIDGNARYGCCTIDGVVHFIEACLAKYASKDTNIPAEAAVVAEYFELTGGADTGLNEAEVLKAWQTIGLFGNKIAGYAPVAPTSLLAKHCAIAFYDGIYLGIKCPRSAQEQFAHGEPWTYRGEETEDGHCVLGLGYNERGEIQVATWGGIATLTPGFEAHYLEEAWVILSEELVAAKKDSLGLDLESLREDLARI